MANNNFSHTPDHIVLTSDIVSRTQLSVATIRRLEKDGLFPRRQLIGKRQKGLPESVFAAWLASRAPTDTAQ